MKMRNAISIMVILWFLSPLNTFANTWAIRYGDQYDDSANSIHEISDGGFIVGGVINVTELSIVDHDYWIQKLDNNGSVVWQRAYDGPLLGRDNLDSFQETADKGFIVAGATDVSNGGQDLWMLKLDHSGDIIWQNIYDYNGSSGFSSVQETSDGGFIVANSTSVPGHTGSRAGVLKLGKNGEVVWKKAYGEHSLNPRSIQETSDGGFILAGNITFTGQSSSTHYWVLKLDSRGNVVWQYAYDSGLPTVHSVKVRETSGGYIVAGQIDNHTADKGKEVRLLKLDTMGNIIWQKSYGGGFGLGGFSDLLVDSDDMIVVAGFIADWRDNSDVGWIIKLDSDGNVIWQKVGDGLPVFQGRGDIEETSDGGFIIAGSIDTGGQKDADFLVLKLDGNGNIPGCSITWNAPSAVQSHPLTPENISFTRITLGRGFIDTDTIARMTYIEPIDTQIVPRDQCSTSYPIYLISSDFDIPDSRDGFTYHDDTINNTHQPIYASGRWTQDKGENGGGALRVTVGGVDGVDIVSGISGGWRKNFALDTDTKVEINLAYNLETFRYDADECAEALVSIDGEIVKVLDKLCGRDQQTGWLTASFHQFLSAGSHTLTVSAYNNKKTGTREKADVYFDEISIVINDPNLEETQCADGIDNDSDDFTDCHDSDCLGSIECPSEPYLIEDFNASQHVFEYQNDLFFDTRHAPYANG
jgi:hypothetical protein